MKHIFSITVFLISVFTGYAQNTTPTKFYSKEKVGYIELDETRDNPDFYLCDELNIMEYYQTNPKYGEGMKSIRLYFEDYLEQISRLVDFESGLITIRFIINCKGKTDRFRVYSVDGDYKSISISKELEWLCVEIVKGMGEWNPGYDSGEYFDSYFTLSLKVRHGKVVDILP